MSIVISTINYCSFCFFMMYPLVYSEHSRKKGFMMETIIDETITSSSDRHQRLRFVRECN
jgi:hypothetical protein